MRFDAEITLDVEVEILDATRGTAGRLGDRPERCYQAEPADVSLAVWLGQNGGRVDLGPHLPADVLESLTAEAVERLQDDEP
ncbi:MAG TPA: hypothetical protein VLK79_16590 [Gaiellales bacterium]|nr:hypothetical protein [Gaiellales bacterium]